MGELAKKMRKKTGLSIPVLSACTILVVVFLVVLTFRFLQAGVRQPLAFNHRIHQENDLQCSDCHLYYKTHSASGRPSLDTCAGCHEEALGSSKGEKMLVEYIKAGKEVNWKRLYQVPEDVFFSHKRHVVLGNLDCAVCHGNIGESVKPPKKPEKIDMEKCMKCHRERGVTHDCISCHR